MSTPDERPWPADLTRLTGDRVRYHRTNHPDGKMTAQALADALTDLGLRYTRAQVTNLESGRREAVTVAEVLALATVLRVPPLLLVVPLGEHERVEITPGRTVDLWTAWRWITGQVTAEADLVEQHDRDWSRQSLPARLVDTYVRHETYVNQLVSSGPEAAPRLAGVRVEMHRRGWELPSVPQDALDAMRESMEGWGYRESPMGTIRELPLSEVDQ